MVLVPYLIYLSGLFRYFSQAEALILAVAGGSDLLENTQRLYFEQHQNRVTKVTIIPHLMVIKLTSSSSSSSSSSFSFPSFSFPSFSSFSFPSSSSYSSSFSSFCFPSSPLSPPPPPSPSPLPFSSSHLLQIAAGQRLLATVTLTTGGRSWRLCSPMQDLRSLLHFVVQ